MVLAFAAITCVLAPVAYMAMLTGFHAYDDEGYYLANLGDYLNGHPLLTPYAQVYGPFFYEVMGGLFKVVGHAPDNDYGRFITATLWLIASLAGGLVAFRLSRNLWLGVGAEVLTFGVLSALTNEPMGTYGLTAILLFGLLAAAGNNTARPRATAALMGGIVGALCLIKINVGLFAALAVLFAWTGSQREHWRRWLLPLLAVVITVLPFVLTLSLLSVAWVAEFAVVVAFSAAAVGVAGWRASLRPAPSAGWIMAGGSVLVIASMGVALAGGTRVGDVWDGLVGAPLQFPRLFALAIRLNPAYDVVAAVSFAVALAVSLGQFNNRALAETAGLARVGAGFFTWLSMLFMPDSTFLLALPLAWIATQAPERDGADPLGPYLRLLVPILAVVESLQAYPIAGTQLSMAALDLVPVGAITLGDGIRQLQVGDVAAKAVGSVAPAALAINIVVFLFFALTAAAGFRSGVPMGLPGAQSIRLPAQQTASLRQLVAATDKECSTFITFPGMNSFYIWTAKDPPTPVRVEVWWLVLGSNEQQALVQQLAATPGLCVIKNQRVIDMWAAGHEVPRRPLVEFIDRAFVRDSYFGDYELLVSAGS